MERIYKVEGCMVIGPLGIPICKAVSAIAAQSIADAMEATRTAKPPAHKPGCSTWDDPAAQCDCYFR